MPKNWKVAENEGGNFGELENKFHPIILQILANRGIKTKEDLENFFVFDYENDLLDPFLFKDMQKAVERIIEAKEKGEKIAIYGDYDADGVTATALVYSAFSEIGFKGVEYYLPDRQTEGYGINEGAVKYLAEKGVDLIVTVDCGISNYQEIESARNLGMEVIVTDHHHAPEKLPETLAIINPHVPNCGYPEKNLAGVGVAFKLVQALYQEMCPEKTEQIKWLLDLVVIGTVADCVPLLGENRTLVKYGLVVLSKTRRAGLLEMFKVGRIAIDENSVPDTQKIAFQIAPRINAAGRMDHASSSLKLLIEESVVLSRDLALEVESRNQARQKVTGEIVREVKALAENAFKDKKMIFASNPHWQMGILGLIAGKVADEFNKPTAIFQEKDGCLFGSFRSIPQVNIVEAIEKCSDLLIKFGGHSQAAGAQLKAENAEAFYAKISEIVEQELQGKDVAPTLEIDAEVSAENLDWLLMENINKLQPFGEGNEEPVFLTKNLKIESLRIVGNGSKHLKLGLRPENCPKIFDAIGFGLGENDLNLKNGDSLDVVYNLKEDEWNGNRKIQLFLIDIKKNLG